MDEVLARFATESAVLLRQTRAYQNDPTETRVRLALATAKAVRRESTALVRLLAADRDAISTDDKS